MQPRVQAMDALMVQILTVLDEVQDSVTRAKLAVLELSSADILISLVSHVISPFCACSSCARGPPSLLFGFPVFVCSCWVPAQQTHVTLLNLLSRDMRLDALS